MRHRPALSAILLCLFLVRVPAQPPLSEEEKKRLFLKAREEMTTIPYTPPPSTTPGPKPKPRTTPASSPTPSPVVRPPPEATPRPTPLPVFIPKPVPGFTPLPQRPNIVVRETSFAEPDEDRAPTPQPQSTWSRLFGGGVTYRYLTNTVRRAIDRAPVTRGRWRYIVVHNSGTRQGSAAVFDHYHRHVRRMPNGLAYHFVIGNGTSTRDGAIEIGNRWSRQIQGGHVHSDYLNNIAIGICLVGDFNNSQPRQGQLEALKELIDYLRGRVGRIQGQSAVVRAHREINPPQWPTDCPGDEFPYRWLHGRF